MKNNKLIILLILCIFCASCIKNDIPYPYIVGQITTISLVGQKGEPEIIIDKNIINLSVDETVNIKEVVVASMIITDEAVIVPTSDNFLDKDKFPQESFEDYRDIPSRNTKLNFAAQKSATFIIKTYQEYPWTINVTQDVLRFVTVEGQVGDAVIDTENHIALVKIEKSKDIHNVVITDMKLGITGSVMTPDFTTVKDFNRPQTFTITSPFGEVEEWKVDVLYSEASVETSSADPWAKFAYLHGGLVEGEQGVGFEYKTDSESDWTTVANTDVVIDGVNYSAKVTGLLPNTNYSFRAINGDEKAESMTFLTEDAIVLPNGSLDAWSWGTGSATAEKTAYPNADSKNSYWATGNEGVTMAFAGGKPSNSIGVTDAVSGKAGRLESISVNALGFAAGSLVVGEYKTIISLNPEDASKSMKPGREFSSRPLKLKGWYKYSPQIINVVHKNYKDTPGIGDQLGNPDKCHIYIKLEDRTNGANDLIAYGEIKNSDEIDTYQAFEIELEYLLENRKPTHIAIVCSSSYLGDYFTGGLGSVLYVDQFELVYE